MDSLLQRNIPVAKVVWHGPRLGLPTATGYYQIQIKGTVTKRRRKDVLLKEKADVPRLQFKEDSRKAQPTTIWEDAQLSGIVPRAAKGAVSRAAPYGHKCSLVTCNRQARRAQLDRRS